MEEKDTGGPAFPVSGGVGNLEDWKHGMELRDYFASHAPISLMEARQLWAETNHEYRQDPTVAEVIEIMVEVRYAYADAMLKERSKETSDHQEVTP